MTYTVWECAVWDVRGLCVAVCKACGWVSCVNECRLLGCMHIHSVCECGCWDVRFVRVGLCE